MRKTGCFCGCEICNNCSDALRSMKGNLSQAARDIIIRYRRAHLKMQANERLEMEKVIEQCKRVGKQDQPVEIFLCPDGFTEHKGNTPVMRAGGSGRSSKRSDAVYMTNRVIGVQVVCGKLDTYFLYVLDDFVPKGSNCLIEVIRQALRDLQDYCAEDGWTFPRILNIQADNW